MKADIWKPTGSVASVGPQNPIVFAKPYHISEKLKHIPILFQKTPIQPGSDVILAVSIVIAELSI